MVTPREVGRCQQWQPPRALSSSLVPVSSRRGVLLAAGWVACCAAIAGGGGAAAAWASPCGVVWLGVLFQSGGVGSRFPERASECFAARLNVSNTPLCCVLTHAALCCLLPPAAHLSVPFPSSLQVSTWISLRRLRRSALWAGCWGAVTSAGSWTRYR